MSAFGSAFGLPELRDVGPVYLAWPWALALLPLIPLGWFVYLRGLRERWRRTALYFSHGVAMESIRQQPARWRRLARPLLFSLLAFLLILGLARPTVSARVPVRSPDMMLVMDISLSMLAEDIRPDRISAAKEAAVRFIEHLPREVRVGLEVFAGDRYVLSPPTRQHGDVIALLRALRREDLQPRTEIGSALQTALQVLTRPEGAPEKKTPEGAKKEAAKTPERLIILLSDGDSHEGYPWERAAEDAVRRNVAIYTVGIGSPEGSVIQYQGMTLPVTFNEATLRRIAEIAHGRYFRVFRASDFEKVYHRIRESSLHYEDREVDLAFVTAAVALLALGTALLL